MGIILLLHLKEAMPCPPAVTDRRTVWEKTIDANAADYRTIEKAATSWMTAVSDSFAKLFSY